jgi:pimeloyl-ACP methyl ester carboxylesterase
LLYPLSYEGAGPQRTCQEVFDGAGECDAVRRHLRVAGLDGLVDPADPDLAAAVAPSGEGWRSTFDPRAFAVGEPGVAGLLAAARVPVLLARGEHDTMVTWAQLAALVPDPVELSGLGHNAHVEDPAAVLALIRAYLAA